MTEVADLPKDTITGKEDIPVANIVIVTGSDDAKEDKESVTTAGADEKITKLEADIIRQLEYYFGDANLNRDKFLLEQIGKDDGWISITLLLTFKRLANLTTNQEIIVNAIHKSDEGLVEVSEDKLKLRRHPERPIPEYNEDRRKEISSRTAYAKGFPLDAEMSDIIEYFNAYDKVLNITMRKYMDKPTKTYKFKGSVFVTFAKKEQCEDFVNKEKVVYKEKELIRKWQEQYLEEKKEERNQKKKPKNTPKNEEENKIELPKGAVIYFEGASEENTTREHIRAAIEAIGGAEVSYIEYSKGEKNGYIRLTNEDTAKPLVEKCEKNELKLKDFDVVLSMRVLEGDEEKQFLEKAIESMKSRRNNQNKFHRGNHRGNQKHGGGGGGHGNRNHRKRRGDHHDHQDNKNGDDDGKQPPAKQEKGEE